MLRKVLWRKRALRDLLGLHSYIAKDRPNAAADYLGRIISACEILGEFPLMGRVWNPRTKLLSLPVETVTIFYLVTDDTVEIKRVVQSSRNLDRIFRRKA